MHSKVSMKIIQNASHVNLLHFGYYKCIEVKGTSMWILFIHSKVSMTIIQNASCVNLLLFAYYKCIEVKVLHSAYYLCIQKLA